MPKKPSKNLRQHPPLLPGFKFPAIDEILTDYIVQMQSSPHYAGRKDFLSKTTWLPTTSEGFCVGSSTLMEPMEVSIIGQIDSSNSSLDPLADIMNWSLPKNFANRLCTVTISNPWLFERSLKNDFLHAVSNLCLLSESIAFNSFSHENSNFSCLDVSQLYQNRIVLKWSFFEMKVSASG